MSDPRSVVLHAVGDIALGDHPLCTGFGTHSRSRQQPPTFPFQHVAEVLARADIRFGNLECTLSERGLRPNDYHSVQMRGHAEYVAGLAAADFKVVNVANNHSMQHGAEPFTDTVDMLRAAGIAVCGVRDGNASAPVYVTTRGLRVSFLGYSLRPRQYFTQEPLYAEGRERDIITDVRGVRRHCDVCVVSLHWGDEFIDRPSPADVQLAHAIVDEGADLIIGHHPHVLRGVERYGRGWIVYSLGNFVCDMLWEEQLRETAICECRMTPDGVEDVRLIPARINDHCQPVPLCGEAAGPLERRLADLNLALSRPQAGPKQPEVTDEYEEAAHLAHSTQRTRSHRYFLRNAYRFPPRILVAQLLTYARNRLAERGWDAPAAS
jgi:poly-gamma-glutamate synthesis protein (capsule biosynthesis protein)